MKCCSCKNADLEPMELEHGLLAATCPQCHGSLLPLMNYRYWADHNEHVSAASTELAQEPEGAKNCPKCNRMMTKYRIDTATNNRIELCAHCDEVWLDAGEWNLIKTLKLHDKLSSVFTEAWQRNLRKQKEKASLYTHFETLLGEQDFSRAREFKEWLEVHPKKSDIRHFVNMKFD
ncbi:TFIIB-like protein [Alteromonadaceae bacterium 2753L.S.0a.02]|nr:TFIIB-like protein [Alteromonadaceae bacterium 2753L.S.0a.02]